MSEQEQAWTPPPQCVGGREGHSYKTVTTERRQGEMVAEVYEGESCTRCGHWIPRRPGAESP